MLERSFTVDVLKVVAAQFIVWHHFSAYGPMADTMTLVWPNFVNWLYEDARLAVQVFLVVGGYLAGQSVMNKPIDRPLTLIAKRYLRLVPFYMLALTLISGRRELGSTARFAIATGAGLSIQFLNLFFSHVHHLGAAAYSGFGSISNVLVLFAGLIVPEVKRRFGWRGAIIGVVDVVDVVRKSSSAWWCGPVGLVLANPRAIEAIPCKGQLGFFTWERSGEIAQPMKWMLPPEPKLSKPKPPPAMAPDLFNPK